MIFFPRNEVGLDTLNLFSSCCRTGSAEPCLFLLCVLCPIFHVSLRWFVSGLSKGGLWASYRIASVQLGRSPAMKILS